VCHLQGVGRAAAVAVLVIQQSLDPGDRIVGQLQQFTGSILQVGPGLLDQGLDPLEVRAPLAVAILGFSRGVVLVGVKRRFQFGAQFR
jgi:hypothetical protein